MTDNGYGLWFLVAFNSLLFIFFAASFFHPQSKRDWRALGGFSAFIGGGFWLIATGWKHLFEAQKAQLLATTGP